MTKLIPILSGRCLVVELPEGAKHKRIEVRHLGCFLVTTSTRGELMAKLPPGNWRIIGMLSEVTNAELADVTGFYYNKYNERYVEMPTSAMRATPIGDIEDAIKAEGYYLDENPIEGQEPNEEDFELKGRNEQEWKMIEEDRNGMKPSWKSILRSNYYDRLKDWQKKYDQAQSRVLDRSRCLLLGREA